MSQTFKTWVKQVAADEDKLSDLYHVDAYARDFLADAAIDAKLPRATEFTELRRYMLSIQTTCEEALKGAAMAWYAYACETEKVISRESYKALFETLYGSELDGVHCVFGEAAK